MAAKKRSPKGTFTATEVGSLIEALRAEFRVFGEGLEDVRGRIAAVEAEVRAFRDFTMFQKLVSETLRNNVDSLTAMARKMTADIAAIRDDIHSFKERLTTVEAKVGP